MVAKAGRGALLAKVDIKSAYRIVEVYPEDRPLLGMLWDGGLHVHRLGIAIRSPLSPKIFTALADALEWIVRQAGVETVFHYLDDFLIVGNPASEQCKVDLQRLLEVFGRLHIPVAFEKLDGPAMIIIFLGIELDTQLMILRLPQEKLSELRTLLTQWQAKKFCLKKDLQSLVGKLQHACKVVRLGRTFLRCMFELLKGTSRRHCFIRLNTAFRSDLSWWCTFLESWNGISMLEDATNRSPDCHLFSDASGSLGCGAWSGSSWFHYLWPNEFSTRSIAVKELLPIVMACIVWGKAWRRKKVLAHCDNQAVVEVDNSGYSKDAQLLCSLFFITAYLEIALEAVHIPGHRNTGADAISWDNHSSSLTGARGTSLPNPSTSHSVRPTSPPASRLDITQLVPVVQDLFTAGLVASTRRAYKSGGNRYLKFCREAQLTPYPTTEEIYCYSLPICTRQSLLMAQSSPIWLQFVIGRLGVAWVAPVSIPCPRWNMC